MIQVISLSPAVDVTYEVDEITLGETHRVSKATSRPGGKALNVVRILSKLCIPTHLILPLGGPHGVWVAAALEALDVPFTPVPVASPTRQCVTLLDGPRPTEFNEPPPALFRIEVEALADAVRPAQVSILSGSVSPDIGEDAWASLLKTVRHQSETVIVDTSGWALPLATPYADYVKPNSSELQAVSRVFEGGGIAALAPATVLLSKAEGGAILYTDPPVFARTPPQQGNPTGAGDALVAGFASQLEKGATRALRFGVALAAASVRSPVAGDLSLEVLEELLPLVEMSDDAPRSH